MSSRKSLTGGTNDVNPQFYSFRIAQAEQNQTVNIQLPTPISKLQTSNKQATVMEVLKVFFTLSQEINEVFLANWIVTQQSVFLSTAPNNVSNMAFRDPTVFAHTSLIWATVDQNVPVTQNAGFAWPQEPFIYDCTDGAGHGILIATDSIFVQMQSGGFDAPAQADVKIMYRFKKVSLDEYVGIVQSQQSPSQSLI